MSTQTKGKTFTPVTDAITAIRRTRRAYVGLHGLAFERAQERFEKARLATDKLFDELVVKGEEVEGQFKSVSEDAIEKGRDMIPSVSMPSLALPVLGRGKRVDALKTKVADLQAKLDKMTAKPKKSSKPKKVKTIKTDRTVKAVKAEAKDAVAAVKKEKVLPKDTAVVEKAAEAAVKAEKVADKYEPFIADVLRYDASADAVIIKKIVDHLGIALQSRDGKFVACSDETERNTVRDSWLVKALRIQAASDVLDAKVMKVCDMMSDDRMKNRVTFYYLIAKNEGKLSSF